MFTEALIVNDFKVTPVTDDVRVVLIVLWSFSVAHPAEIGELVQKLTHSVEVRLWRFRNCQCVLNFILIE